MTSIQSLLSPQLQYVLAEIGFKTLTPIQEQAIPLLIAGRDVTGQSKTGSGKTAAFALPLLERLKLGSKQVQAMVICPTRELCAQVAREIRKFGRRHAGLHVVVLAGGQTFRPQALALQSGAHVVVGTPGRLLDHIKRRTVSLDSLKYLVLDEADRMLDMGFEEDMREILAACPEHRQTALFSATFPPGIEALSAKYQKSPARVTIADGEESDAQSQKSIRQGYFEVEPTDKVATLLWSIRNKNPQSSVVFCNMKAMADSVAQTLAKAGISAAALHGDLEQFDRDRVLAKFRNRSIRVLVATDVAARGLDVEAVDVVYNFELPSKPEVYVHRIGRTGRAGKAGQAIAIATARERHKIAAIEVATSMTMQRLPTPHPDQLEITATREEQEAPMATLRIGGGRKAKVRPGDILGALTGQGGGLPASAVGKIEIHDYFAYVAVNRDLIGTAQNGLMSGGIKGRKFNVTLEA